MTSRFHTALLTALPTTLLLSALVSANAASEPHVPASTPAIRKLIDQSRALAAAKQTARASDAAAKAITAARQAHDRPGEMFALRERALRWQEAGRVAEALADWEATMTAARRLRCGPEQVEARLAQVFQLWRQQPAAARRRLAQVEVLARREGRRPLAAGRVLQQAARTFYENGALPEADRLFRLARGVGERYAPGTLVVAHALNGLGAVALSRGDPMTAQACFQRAWRIFQQRAPDSPDAVGTLSNLGAVTYSRGDLHGARALFQQVLQIREKRSPGSLEHAGSLNNLAAVAQAQGDLVAARNGYQQALNIRLERGAPPLQIAGSLNNLGIVVWAQGDLPAARTYLQDALRRYEQLVPDTLDVSDALSNLGAVAVAAGDLTAAWELFQRALRIRAVLSPGSLVVASCLHNPGAVAYHRGDLKTARELLQRALEIRHRRVPGSLDEAASLVGLGGVALEQSDLAAAQSFFRRGLAFQEQHAPHSLDVASSLSSLGSVAHLQGDLGAALTYYQRALVLRRRHAPGSLLVAGSLHDLATIAHSRGELATARDLCLQALTLREAQAPDTLDVAETLQELGSILRDSGDLDSARDRCRRALAIRERRAPGSLVVAATLVELGIVADDAGDLSTARDYYYRAMEIQGRLAPNSLQLANSFNNLGGLARVLGDLPAARDYHERALAIRQAQAPNSAAMAASLANLGNVAWSLGDLATAQEYHVRALQIKKKLAPESLEVADSLFNLGNVAHDRGDRSAAGKFYQRALELRQRMSPGSVAVAVSLYNLGVARLAEGDRVAARDFFQRSLEIYRTLAPDALGAADVLAGLGSIAADDGDLPGAETYAREAWSLVQKERRGITDDEARQAFVSSYDAFAARLVDYQWRAGKLTEAFMTREEGRAQALQQLLSERGIAESLVTPGVWSDYKRAEAAANRAGEELAKAGLFASRAEEVVKALPPPSRDAREPERARAQLAKAVQRREAALAVYTQARLLRECRWAEVKRSAPDVFLAPMTLAEARRVLPPESLLLAFVTGERGTLLFLVPSAKDQPISAFFLPLNESALAERVRSLRELMGARIGTRGITLAAPPAAGNAVAEASRALCRELFPRDVRAAITQAQRLVISPDGPLWDLPFAALVTNEDGPATWLGLEKPLTTTPALFLYARARQRPRIAAGKRSALIVGNPDAGVATPTGSGTVPPADRLGEAHLLFDGRTPPSLPYAEMEARQIAALYGTAPLVGTAATETAVRERLPQATMIQLATHGYFHPYRGMSSGVLLAPPRQATADAAQDGVLQAWEIFSQLRLQADLVVLSACETGRGERVRGEGLIGLTRALEYAGARSVLVSQWQVADPSTAALMVAFHRALRAGSAKDEALMRAMRQVQNQAATRAPYYWAAFCLNE